MGLAALTQTHAWKNFMAKLYGIGAAIVIIGALFKIMHWPGASLMLIAGLGTEAVIFFFSAFEPLHEEIDWTLVYPELAGLGDHDEVNVKKKKEVASTSSGDALAKFDQMLEKAGGAGLFEKLGTGLNNLTDKVSNMNQLTDSALVTNEFANKVKAAGQSVDSLSEAYKKSAGEINTATGKMTDSYKKAGESLTYSIESLADGFNKSGEKVLDTNNAFAAAYVKLTDNMNIDFSALKEGNKAYSDKLSSLNKNLAALNAIFEMQLNEADLDKMMSDLQGSVTHSKKYNEEVTKLGKRLEALNDVYGKMLTAMNVKV